MQYLWLRHRAMHGRDATAFWTGYFYATTRWTI